LPGFYKWKLEREEMEEGVKHVQYLPRYGARMQTRCAELEAARFCTLGLFSLVLIASRKNLGLEGPLEVA